MLALGDGDNVNNSNKNTFMYSIRKWPMNYDMGGLMEQMMLQN